VLLLSLLYGLACAVVAVHAFGVLTDMNRRTANLRRSAFILLAWGGFIGMIEMWVQTFPVLSLFSLVAGGCLLLAAGVRWPLGHRARYERPRSMGRPCD
jgi:hypothetical protein